MRSPPSYVGAEIPGEFSPWWEFDDTHILELVRLPSLRAGQLAAIGKSPGKVFVWADGTGVAGGTHITVVPASTR